jgi:hypothetical protein
MDHAADMKTHRVPYAEVGLLVPAWKIAVSFLAASFRLRRLVGWCLSYRVSTSIERITRAPR